MGGAEGGDEGVAGGAGVGIREEGMEVRGEVGERGGKEEAGADF